MVKSIGILLIESQTSELNRNELIVRIVRFFRDRNLILSKRVNQVVWIVKRLETLGESVTSLVGLKKVVILLQEFW